MKGSVLSDNIARFRIMRGMTQAEVAEKLHFTPQTVSSWERNNSSPDTETLVRLAAVLGVSADELLGVPRGKEARRSADMRNEVTRTESYETPVRAALAVKIVSAINFTLALTMNFCTLSNGVSPAFGLIASICALVSLVATVALLFAAKRYSKNKFFMIAAPVFFGLAILFAAVKLAIASAICSLLFYVLLPGIFSADDEKKSELRFYFSFVVMRQLISLVLRTDAGDALAYVFEAAALAVLAFVERDRVTTTTYSYLAANEKPILSPQDETDDARVLAEDGRIYRAEDAEKVKNFVKAKKRDAFFDVMIGLAAALFIFFTLSLNAASSPAACCVALLAPAGFVALCLPPLGFGKKYPAKTVLAAVTILFIAASAIAAAFLYGKSELSAAPEILCYVLAAARLMLITANTFVNRGEYCAAIIVCTLISSATVIVSIVAGFYSFAPLGSLALTGVAEIFQYAVLFALCRKKRAENH